MKKKAIAMSSCELEWKQVQAAAITAMEPYLGVVVTQFLDVDEDASTDKIAKAQKSALSALKKRAVVTSGTAATTRGAVSGTSTCSPRAYDVALIAALSDADSASAIVRTKGQHNGRPDDLASWPAHALGLLKGQGAIVRLLHKKSDGSTATCPTRVTLDVVSLHTRGTSTDGREQVVMAIQFTMPREMVPAHTVVDTDKGSVGIIHFKESPVGASPMVYMVLRVPVVEVAAHVRLDMSRMCTTVKSFLADTNAKLTALGVSTVHNDGDGRAACMSLAVDDALRNIWGVVEGGDGLGEKNLIVDASESIRGLTASALRTAATHFIKTPAVWAHMVQTSTEEILRGLTTTTEDLSISSPDDILAYKAAVLEAVVSSLVHASKVSFGAWTSTPLDVDAVLKALANHPLVAAGVLAVYQDTTRDCPIRKQVFDHVIHAWCNVSGTEDASTTFDITRVLEVVLRDFVDGTNAGIGALLAYDLLLSAASIGCVATMLVPDGAIYGSVSRIGPVCPGGANLPLVLIHSKPGHHECVLTQSLGQLQCSNQRLDTPYDNVAKVWQMLAHMVDGVPTRSKGSKEPAECKSCKSSFERLSPKQVACIPCQAQANLAVKKQECAACTTALTELGVILCSACRDLTNKSQLTRDSLVKKAAMETAKAELAALQKQKEAAQVAQATAAKQAHDAKAADVAAAQHALDLAKARAEGKTMPAQRACGKCKGMFNPLQMYHTLCPSCHTKPKPTVPSVDTTKKGNDVAGRTCGCGSAVTSSDPKHHLCDGCAPHGGSEWRSVKPKSKKTKDTTKSKATEEGKDKDAGSKSIHDVVLSKKIQAAIDELFAAKNWGRDRRMKFVYQTKSAVSRGVPGETVLAGIRDPSLCKYGQACPNQSSGGCGRKHPAQANKATPRTAPLAPPPAALTTAALAPAAPVTAAPARPAPAAAPVAQTGDGSADSDLALRMQNMEQRLGTQMDFLQAWMRPARPASPQPPPLRSTSPPPPPVSNWQAPSGYADFAAMMHMWQQYGPKFGLPAGTGPGH